MKRLLVLALGVVVGCAGCHMARGPMTGRLYSSWFSVKGRYPAPYYAEVCQEYRSRYPSRPAWIHEEIAAGRVRAGMSAEEARLAWGEPARVERGAVARDSGELWIYGRGSGRRFVHLVNGYVTSQETPEGARAVGRR